jgi:Spy/CpxP family protein refolding chaperone
LFYLIEMVMNTRIIKATGLGFIGILMVTAVYSQSPRYGMRGAGPNGPRHGYAYGLRDTTLADRPYRMMGRMDFLELSDEQQQQLTDLRVEQNKAITPLQNKLGELRAKERTLLSEDKVDMDAVNKNLDEQSDLMNSIRKLRVEHQVKVKGILTDEQLMKMQTGRQFAQRDDFYGRGGRGGRDFGDPRPGRGYRGR